MVTHRNEGTSGTVNYEIADFTLTGATLAEIILGDLNSSDPEDHLLVRPLVSRENRQGIVSNGALEVINSMFESAIQHKRMNKYIACGGPTP